MDTASTIRAIMAARKWTQEQLADRLQTSQNNISRWLSGMEPRGKTRDAIRALAIEAGVLDEPARPTPSQHEVPIMGYLGAGAEIEPDYEQVPPDGLDQVELPFPIPDEVIGLQVKGDSMLPKYDDGDVVVVYREPQRSVGDLMFEEAAVRTHEGRRYLKRIMPGPKAHTYNLESINARPIIGARIAWASEIIAVVPARKIRRIGRRSAQRRGGSEARSGKRGEQQ